MSSAGFTKRRGLRAIVKRGPVVSTRVGGTSKQTVDLELECGHKVTRGANSVRLGCQTAVCPTCRKADGDARDKAKAAAQ